MLTQSSGNNDSDVTWEVIRPRNLVAIGGERDSCRVEERGERWRR